MIAKSVLRTLTLDEFHNLDDLDSRFFTFFIFLRPLSHIRREQFDNWSIEVRKVVDDPYQRDDGTQPDMESIITELPDRVLKHFRKMSALGDRGLLPLCPRLSVESETSPHC
jgi:hypothetical protein